MNPSSCLRGILLLGGGLASGVLAIHAQQAAHQGLETPSGKKKKAPVDHAQSPFPGERAPEVAGPVKPDKPEKIGKDHYRIGKIDFNRKEGTIWFEGEVNQTEGAIEYAVVTREGKRHEALLAAPIKPFNLQIALLLMGAKPSLEMFPHLPEELRSKASLPRNERWKSLFTMEVSWTPKGKAKRTVNIGEWIRNVRTMDQLKDAQWQFGGSRIVEGRLVAQADGSAVAIYQDSGAIANYTGSGNDNDEEWFPSEDVMPQKGTKVTITIKLKKKPVVKP